MLNPFNPLPTIQAILGMPIKVHHVQIVLDELDFDLECEGIHHAEGIWGHSGSAAFMQVGGCPKCTGYRCAGVVQSHPNWGEPCDDCHIPFTNYKFIPLDAS